jgi:uncharacterized membrane protein YkoI
MNNLIKTTLSVLLASTLVYGGLTATAQANSANRNNRTIFAQEVKDEMKMNEDQEIKENQESEEDEKLEEQQETARLQPLAKITADQAKESALKVQSGEVTELELEAENGSLVYEVTVGETEVFVDAGNGEVLYTQGVNEKVDETTEQARPRSSIQVPNEDNNQ